jgi:hypothetical protein
MEETASKSAIPAANAEELLDVPMTSHNNRSRTTFVAYATMLGLLLFGIFAAISHHLFYSYLDNREIDEAAVPQNWVIRIGNAFAYLFKTCLVAAVAVAYAQGFWFLVRRKSLEIRSLDFSFGVLYNPVLLFNVNLFQKTTSLFGLAVVSWLLPISAVFSPGALTGCPLFPSIS